MRKVEWVIHQRERTANLPGDRLAARADAFTLTGTLTSSPAIPPARRPGALLFEGVLDDAERGFLGDHAAAFPALRLARPRRPPRMSG